MIKLVISYRYVCMIGLERSSFISHVYSKKKSRFQIEIYVTIRKNLEFLEVILNYNESLKIMIDCVKVLVRTLEIYSSRSNRFENIWLTALFTRVKNKIHLSKLKNNR